MARSVRAKKGITTYSGTTEVQLRAGDLNFHSTGHDSLAFVGSTAQYGGSGTINGMGDFGFTITVVDVGGGGDKKASTASDTFRIKIWDRDTAKVIYDSQPGAGDNAAPTTTLGGGNIVIHKG